jgi:hydroxyacylglutathione hydrolase
LLEKAAGMMDTAVIGARQQFNSLQRFKQLPDYLQVWPAHGAGSACGKGLGAIPSSTVGYEKLFNPALGYRDEAEFIEYLLADQPEPPHYFAVMKRVNKEGPALLGGLPNPPHLPADRLPTLLAEGAQIVDARPSSRFAEAYLAGAINIPAESLSAWAGWLVDYNRPLYLIVASEELATAARDLIYIGVDKLAGYFRPAALDYLAETGHRLDSYTAVPPQPLADKILNGDVTVVDVRGQSEWAEGHLPGAKHIMLGYLARRAEEVVNGQPIVVQCRSGARSAIAASILRAAGAQEVINLAGGIRDWEAAGLPLVKD